MARPPASLPPTTTNPLKVSLILGSFVHSPAQYELFDLSLPASQPPPTHADEITFAPRPEITHTFRPEQRIPAKAVSAFFGAFVFWPWLVLLGFVRPSFRSSDCPLTNDAWCIQWYEIGPRVPHLFSPHVVPFVVSLAAFEGLLFWYWVDLRLGQVLLYGGILAIPTALAGKQALVKTSEWRLGRK